MKYFKRKQLSRITFFGKDEIPNNDYKSIYVIDDGTTIKKKYELFIDNDVEFSNNALMCVECFNLYENGIGGNLKLRCININNNNNWDSDGTVKKPILIWEGYVNNRMWNNNSSMSYVFKVPRNIVQNNVMNFELEIDKDEVAVEGRIKYLWYQFDADPVSSSTLTDYGISSFDMTIVNNESYAYTGPTDLYLWYKFDNNADDSSVNSYDATALNHNQTPNPDPYDNTDVKKGVFSSKFNGSDIDKTIGQYFELPNPLNPFTNQDEGASTTICFWFKMNAYRLWQRIFDWGTANAGIIFVANNSNQNLTFCVNNKFGANFSFQYGTWYHITWILIKGTGGVDIPHTSDVWKIYVNGTLYGTYTNSVNVNYPQNNVNYFTNYIGKSNWSDRYLNGLIDDFRFYQRELSEAEIGEVVGTKVITRTTGKPSYHSDTAYFWRGSTLQPLDNSYLEYTNATNIGTSLIDNIASDFKISFVYNFGDITTPQEIFNITTSFGRVIIIRKNTNTIHFNVGNGLGDVAGTDYKSIETNALNIDTWYKVVCSMSISGINDMTLSIKIDDGIPTKSTFYGFDHFGEFPLTGLKMYIGRYENENSDLSPAYLQDFTLTKKIITDDLIFDERAVIGPSKDYLKEMSISTVVYDADE